MRRGDWMKKYRAIIMIIIGFAVIGGILGLYFSYKEESKENTSALNGEEIYNLKTISGNCTDSKDIIDSFLETTQKGEIATLKIEEVISDDDSQAQKTNSNSYNKEIVFDGKNYLLKNENISSEYLYFYKVTGSLPNAETRETQYILANEKYSYEEISQSILSSSSNDQLEYVLVCFTNN
jgi:hypothetical protein